MPPVAQPTRGALKLQAAVERFGLRQRIAGARCVDVGASTGGFTATLLEAGAAHVTAVDVGSDQLLPELRADARVTSLEKTDWKTLALSIAPGPFDFFTVDVSFVAARNMLRGLAFRLRDGAEGVVLVKPQFELPDQVAKSGGPDDPGLRSRAVRAFTDKARALGFRVLEHVDSPVPGGEGTIEVLAHVRFDGRPATMPAPGQKVADPRPPAKKAKPKRQRAFEREEFSLDHLHWFAVAAPGLEALVRDEVAALREVGNVREVPGGVEFDGPLAIGLRANLHLRIATRVLLRLGAVDATDFAVLRRRLADLPWPIFLPRDRPLRVTAAATRCRLYHTGALTEQVVHALRDRLGGVALARGGGAAGDDAEGDDDVTRVAIRGERDRFTVSLDSSGALLHRRGWRPEGGRAPLRETLAAAILRLAGHDPARPFVDPMCGSGTFAIEACAAAIRRAPGLARTFAFERWRCFDPAAWDALRAEARAVELAAPAAPIFALDQDPEAVALARRNADRAVLGAHLTIEQAPLGDWSPPAGPGLVIANPPYGRRLPTTSARIHAQRELTRALRARFSGWTAGLLLPEPVIEEAVDLRIKDSIRLQNGGLRVRLLVTKVP